MSQSNGNGQSPPVAVDAERAVIGSLLLSRDAEAVRRTLASLSPDEIWSSYHRIIYRTIGEMHRAGGVVDAVTLCERLGPDYLPYLSQCMEAVQHASHMGYYADIVRDRAERRRRIEAAKQQIADAFDISRPIDHGTAGFKPMSIWELKEKFPNLRPPVIEGLLRQGETMGIHAKSKVGKSWTAYGLALSVISKSHWLGRFACTPGNVLLIDNELHEEDLSHRIPTTVLEAMSLTRELCRAEMDVESLRGRLKDVFTLQKLFDRMPHGHYSLIIIDAFYRILPKGVSENDNAAMAEVFNQIDAYALQTGAAFVLIHHASKGDQSGKDVVDVGSGAGSISRAVDAHLVLRPHEEPDHLVLDAKVRSFAPIDPIVLRWNFPRWQVAEDLDPSALKGRKSAKDEAQSAKDQKGTNDIIGALRDGGAMTEKSVRDAIGMGRERCKRLLGTLFKEKKVTRKTVNVRGNECFEYELL